jgi:hypothetical protein
LQFLSRWIRLTLRSDTQTDEHKRQRAWTTRLRGIAHEEVDLMNTDHSSSLINPAFSNATKARAKKELLPSFFDVIQSYEDFVRQNHLWIFPDVSKAPSGKSITCRSIPQPRMQTVFHKAPPTAEQQEFATAIKAELVDESVKLMEDENCLIQLIELMKKSETVALATPRVKQGLPTPVLPCSDTSEAFIGVLSDDSTQNRVI